MLNVSVTKNIFRFDFQISRSYKVSLVELPLQGPRSVALVLFPTNG